ncbi:hypothetical protein NDU88_007525 [Pleurodeles waltl]|uniref:Uncharacterized protein n=1 Tax=Pleurodeles waltl TaxID=8319 RepID=A0AAV7ST57_PLEWA|nr:hypothetical protein NDU88_007525 [Pleurodeles waltl]
MQSAGHQQCSYGGNRGPNRGPPRSSLHQGPEFRPSPPPVSARSESTYYRPGPVRTCRGPGNRKARKNSPAEGRKRPRGPASPAAAHTRSKQREKGGEGRGPKQPPIRLPGLPRTPVSSPLGREQLQRLSSPHALQESARAGDRRRQAPQHKSSSRAPTAAKPGSRSVVGVPRGESQGSAPFTAACRISYIA